MRQRWLKIFSVALGTFALAVSVAQASDTLFIHSKVDKSVELGTIRCITFGNGNLLLKTSNSSIEASLIDITKITFSSDKANSNSQLKTTNIDIALYFTPQGDVVVKTPLMVRSINVYDINGRLVLRTADTKVNTGTLAHGVYLLQIGTEKGSVTKKIIKK
jgi:hypothetical protein